MNDWYREYQLLNNGIETVAKITKVSSVGVRDPVEIENVAFEFAYHDSIINGYTVAETNNKYALTPDGMPLSVNDEFTVKLVKGKPEIYELDFSKPSLKTIEHYIDITSKTLINLKIFTAGEKQKSQCICLSQNIFLKYGTDGLAMVLFNDEFMTENFSHNAVTFKKFIGKKEVKELIERCK
ncbi:MAG: hypothetical protein COX07_05440 [Bacteroidetes bacterium CG23_combo_of_CG06-09_8_20_14_all_32_9]|nr:MAG: hypothetical protein COX07_05440 [Bacteroidetes bacterium CG23_combo_of_CG06-09_8_20_14_all_32_9]